MHSSLISSAYRHLSRLPGFESAPPSESNLHTPPNLLDVAHSAMASHKPNSTIIENDSLNPSWAQSSVTSIKEVCLRTLKGKWRLSTSVNLPGNCALGLTIQTQEHDQNSALILDNEYRTATTRALKNRSGKAVLWTESKGIMEAGSGLGGTLPLGNLASINCGFYPKTLLCYRSLYPHVSGLWNVVKSTLAGHTRQLPLNATMARTMPAGSLFELSGIGQISGRAGAKVAAGIGPCDVFMAGATAGLELSHTQSSTYSLEVMAINGSNLFRISLGKISETQDSLTGVLSAGISARPDKLIPVIGEGAVKAVIEKLGAAGLRGTVDAFFRLQASGGIYHRHADADNLIFVLNIDYPRGEELYRRLISLDSAQVMAAANQKNSGIKYLIEDLVTEENGRNCDVVLGPQQLFMAQAAQIIDEGELTLADGSRIDTHREIFRKRTGLSFFGSKEVSFSTMTVQSSDESLTAPCWRLAFKESIAFSRQDDVDTFLRLFLAAKAHPDKAFQLRCPKMNLIAKIFTSIDDLNSLVDIYLSESGIQRINSATEKEARSAFLKIAYELSEERKPLLMGAPDEHPKKSTALEIVSRYKALDEITTLHPKKWYHKMVEKRELRRRYCDLTYRDLRADLQQLKQAELFACEVGKLSCAQNEDQARNFFIHLGKSTGFNFRQNFLTLCAIAGDENTLIHRLSLKGAGVYVEAVDEGQITLPKEDILRIYEHEGKQ